MKILSVILLEESHILRKLSESAGQQKKSVKPLIPYLSMEWVFIDDGKLSGEKLLVLGIKCILSDGADSIGILK